MERLTIKNSDGTYSQPTHTTFEKMFYRLADFEDFLEAYGYTDLEEFRKAIEFMRAMNNVGAKNFKELQDLKAEIIKECKEHQEAMQVADKRIKELEKALELACEQIWLNTTCTPNVKTIIENFKHKAQDELGMLKVVRNVKD